MTFINKYIDTEYALENPILSIPINNLTTCNNDSYFNGI